MAATRPRGPRPDLRARAVRIRDSGALTSVMTRPPGWPWDAAWETECPEITRLGARDTRPRPRGSRVPSRRREFEMCPTWPTSLRPRSLRSLLATAGFATLKKGFGAQRRPRRSHPVRRRANPRSGFVQRGPGEARAMAPRARAKQSHRHVTPESAAAEADPAHLRLLPLRGILGGWGQRLSDWQRLGSVLNF